MAAEAFDPFADDDDFLHDRPRLPPPRVVDLSLRRSASPRDVPRGGGTSRTSPRGSPGPGPDASDRDASQFSEGNSSYSGGAQRGNGDRADDVMKEFDAVFPSMTLNDSCETDQFGFPSSCFPAAFELAPGGDDANASSRATPSQSNPGINNNLEGVTFVIAEEMSVIHNSRINQCSVKVRGNVSLEVHSYVKPGQHIHCDISFIDPNGHIDAAATKSYDYARPIASADEFTTMNPIHTAVGNTAFRISMPETTEREDDWSGCPLIEYTCGDKLRPVPMLINTDVQEFEDHCQITFQLRVNPRNKNSLTNAVVLASVPDEFDGRRARVSSVDRAVGRVAIDADWSDVTRILSWRLGELQGGSIREFEALFPPGDVGPAREAHGREDARLPVLLRYDSDGSLLSDVDLDFGEGSGPPSVKRKFRVYHREV